MDKLEIILENSETGEKTSIPINPEAVNKSFRDEILLYKAKYNEESIKYCQAQSKLFDIKEIIAKRDEGEINTYYTIDKIKEIIKDI